MKKELTCIGCPMGCRITADLTDGVVSNVEGYTCNIGKNYAHEELTCPKRIVTALVRAQGTDEPLSVKTDRAIEKSLIFDCLAALREIIATRPAHIGDVIAAHVCGTDVNIVATKNLD